MNWLFVFIWKFVSIYKYIYIYFHDSMNISIYSEKGFLMLRPYQIFYNCIIVQGVLSYFHMFLHL